MSVSEFSDELLLEIAEVSSTDSADTNRQLLADHGPAALLSQILIYIDFLEGYNISSLLWAVSYGYVPLAKLLLNTGANVNVQNNQGYTALHIAVFANNVEMVELLLGHEGVDVDHQSAFFETPLYCAVYHAHEDSTERVIWLLIEAGADTSIINYRSM